MQKFSKATPTERRSYLLSRYEQLKTQRNYHSTMWKDVSRYISPFSGRFNAGNHGEGRSFDLILDSTAERSLDTLSSGMMSSASSPSRSWFSLVTTDPDLQKDKEVSVWLSQCESALQRTFEISNTYTVLQQMYKELALFGVSANVITESPFTIIENHLLSAGEFAIGSDSAGNVNTLYREFELTTSQAVRQFGYDKVSRSIQQAYDSGYLQAYWRFIQAIEPRDDRDVTSKFATEKRFASYYLDLSAETGDNGGVVSEGGYDLFPCVVPRWEVLGNDPYGTSPCIKLLPDVKQLQQEIYRKLEMIDQMAHPPLLVPQSARNGQISLKAGALNYTAGNDAVNAIKPMLQNNGDANVLVQDIANLQNIIKEGLFVKQFLILEEAMNNRKTTVEVYALKEEKMLALGSVAERINNECLKPYVNITLARLAESGVLPPAPRKIENVSLQVEFQSVLAQAQKAIDLNSVDRFMSTTMNLASVFPDVLNRVDTDGLIDAYAQRIGVDPQILRSREEANQIRQQQAEAQQKQQELDQAQQQSLTAQQLAQAQKSGTEASLANQQLQTAQDSIGA